MSQDKRDIAIEKAKKIIEQYPDKNDYVCKYIVRSYDHNNNPTDDSIELDEFWEDCKRIIALPSKEQGTGADKTAMQQLIEKYKGLPKSENAWTNKFVAAVINDATELLETERQQHYDSFVAGDERGTKGIPFNAEQYYSNKYTKQ